MRLTRNLALLAPLIAAPGAATANERPLDVFTDGVFKLDLRYRTEYVDDAVNRDALASTLRTAIGYQTPGLAGFSAAVELEDVHVIGNDHMYNDGGSNGATGRAVIVDPEGTELNQAWLRYANAGLTATAGRQVINHRAAPFHRFVGNVGWRQNWQTYDGLRVQYTGEGFSLDGSYVYNVNRIFGEDNPLPNRSDFDVDAGLLRATWQPSDHLDLEAYGYLLNFDDARALSTNTFGLRASGRTPVASNTQLVYGLEYARQTATDDNPGTFRLDYVLTEAGLTRAGWLLKLSFEWLEGDGQRGFSTPLATAHAFQGWADTFLTTPAAGVRDLYVTLKGSVAGFNTLVVAHDYRSVNDSAPLGRELDLQVTRAVFKRVTVGLKAALFVADDHRRNIGPAANDTTKLWMWVRFAL